MGGTVLRLIPGDTVPEAGARVVLHRVGRDLQGPLDSTRTGAGGRFRFRFVPDTTAVYIVSARHSDIEYFSSPVHTNRDRPDTALVLVVSDTSSEVRIEAVSRQVVIGKARADGARDVVDLISLENLSVQTRIPGDQQRPTWLMPLDPSAVGFDIGASDFSPEAVFHRDGTVEVFGPIPPGTKELLLRYVLPPGTERWPIAVADTVRDLSILIEDGALRVVGPALEAPGPQVIGGRSFRTWRARPTAADTIIIVLPAGPPAGGTMALVALVGGLALVLVAAVVAYYRRSTARAPSSGGGEDSAEVLVRRLALLDTRYAGREAEVGLEEWAQYQQRRRLLKRQLERALATGAPPS